MYVRKMSSSMRNFMEAYSAVHNTEAREELSSGRDHISEMDLSHLTSDDLGEIAEQVLAQLRVHVNEVRYFTDSKVVLGYIYNRKRRFYTYVANRVEKILNFSKSSQWHYIDTKHNPADIGTRGASPSQMSDCMWLKGPPEKILVKRNQSSEHFSLHNPDQDKEVRPDVTCLVTRSMEGHSSLDPKYLRKFSSSRRLTKTVCNLQHICKSLNKSCECVGWHLCPEASSAENFESAQCLIFRTFQKES